MKKIGLNKIPLLSKIANDYLFNSESFSEFISATPDLSSFESRIKTRQSINRDVLVEELLIQNKKAPKKAINNIELLRKETTFTVTTGHQICLFTGPLYSIYKIISTLNLTKSLKQKYPEHDFVPVFWMATEDHDFEEINHVNIFDKKITWNTNQSGPVGRFSTTDMIPFLEEIEETIGSELTRTLINFYKSSSNLAIAHNKMINHLFGEEGVVVIDADSEKLKREMISIFKNELTKQNTFEKVEEQSEKLLTKGFGKQVTPREINLFYQKDGLRERITEEDKSYQILNTELVFTQEEILEELDKHPERFSPNVVMRPIYQEKILPNLAYIGGPGELAYWFQLKSAFEVNSIDFPILVLRNMALIVKENISKKINQLPFMLEDYFRPQFELENDYIKQVSEISFEDEIANLEEVFAITKEKAVEVDFSLERTVIAELKRAQNSINKIKKKVTKAEKKKHEVAINRIDSIKEAFFPGGTFQERKLNILEFYQPDLIKNLIQDLNSLEDNLTLLEVQNQ